MLWLSASLLSVFVFFFYSQDFTLWILRMFGTSCGWMLESVCLVPVLCQRYVSIGYPGESTKDEEGSSQLLGPSVSTPIGIHLAVRHSATPHSKMLMDSPSILPFLLSLYVSFLHLSAIWSILLTSSLPCYPMYSLISNLSRTPFNYFVSHVWAAWYRRLAIRVQHGSGRGQKKILRAFLCLKYELLLFWTHHDLRSNAKNIEMIGLEVQTFCGRLQPPCVNSPPLHLTVTTTVHPLWLTASLARRGSRVSS